MKNPMLGKDVTDHDRYEENLRTADVEIRAAWKQIHELRAALRQMLEAFGGVGETDSPACAAAREALRLK
jgi:hypothetical protein